MDSNSKTGRSAATKSPNKACHVNSECSAEASLKSGGSISQGGGGGGGGRALEDIKEELRRMVREIEPIAVKRSSSDQQPAPIIAYRPTYRAVLAKRGYLVRNTLGSGSYSKVKRAICYYGGLRDAAVKIIDRSKAPQDYQEKFMPRELEVWPRLSHPNLIALLDCFQDSRRVYMVLEFADGGDALKFIQKSGAISESVARRWTAQIADAVRYMHDQGVSHRDLKLENLLLDKEKNIKLADFGFVKQLHTGEDLSQTYCGSKSYAAPEILMGRPYDPKKADVWAVGVILYIFVTGKMPFDETKGTKSILEEQRSLEFRWSKTRKQTPVCQQLIRRMFTWEFVDRPNVYSVLSDPWFYSSSSSSSSSASAESSSAHHRPPLKSSTNPCGSPHPVYPAAAAAATAAVASNKSRQQGDVLVKSSFSDSSGLVSPPRP